MGLKRYWPALIWLCAFLSTTVSASQSNDWAVFRSHSGGLVEGELSGSCDVAALPFESHRETMTLALRGGVLKGIKVDQNMTRLEAGGRTIVFDHGATYGDESISIGDQAVTVSWAGGGRRVIFSAGAFGSGPGEPATMTWTAGRQEWAAPSPGPSLGPFWVRSETGAVQTMNPISRWAEETRLSDAQARLAGPVVFYLENARVDWPSGSYGVGPYSELSGPPPHEHAVFRFAMLWAATANLSLPHFSGEAWCSAGRAEVQGVALLHNVTGHGRMGGTAIEFSRRELTLGGAFVVEREVGTGEGVGWSEGSAKGSLSGMAVDFVPVQPTADTAADSAMSVVSGLGAAALLVLFLKLGMGFYARLRRDTVMGYGSRREIRAMIEAGNGLTLVDVCRDASLNPSTARYHLRVLERYGEIAAVKVKGRLCYVPADSDALTTAKGITLRMDPKVSSLRDYLQTRSRPANRVVAYLAQQWNISRSGSWRVIERATRAQVIEKRWVNGELRLCARM